MANSASRTYVDFGDVTPINGASKLTTLWHCDWTRTGGPIILDKGSAGGTRFDIGLNSTQLFFAVGGKVATISDLSTANAFGACVFDGEQATNNNKVRVHLDNSLPTVTVAESFPSTVPNLAGTALSYGRLSWADTKPPPAKNDYFAIYPQALTPEQVSYVYKQIAGRCTFQLDMQRVPVSLANLVGPCEVPGTPFRLQAGGTWKVSEDATGKHWLEYVSGTAYEAWVKNTQAYGTYVFDYYHAASGGYCFFISNVTSIPGSTRNAYAITASSTSLNLVKYSPSGASTTLMAAASSIAVGNWYKIAVTRTSPGVFTVWIKGGAYLDWTMIAATSGTNPATDTAYTTSSYFFFGSTAAGNKFAQPRFFQGVLTADQLREKCP
jgi:hypothetical protein